MNTKTFIKFYSLLLIIVLPIVSKIEIKDVEIEDRSHVPMMEIYYQVPVKEPSISSVKKDNRFENLVTATWRLETGNGTSEKWVHNYNAGGIKCYTQKSDSGGFCIYETEEEGMNDIRELLKSYVSEFGYDYKAIRNKYCPIQDSGCIGDYERFMEVLEEVERRS